MTIGEKIKILRKNIGLTGKQLSELTGIHHVLIRKYETNKNAPKKPHIETIANILQVRPYVISDNRFELQLETIGDFYSIIILLYKFGFIEFNISKVSNNIDVQINNRVSQLFDLKNYESGKPEIINQHTFLISAGLKLKETSSYDKFVEWIEECKEFESFKNSLLNPTTENAIKTINMFQEKIEILELKLQQSTELLKNLQ